LVMTDEQVGQIADAVAAGLDSDGAKRDRHGLHY
jgi:hypothetical protein